MERLRHDEKTAILFIVEGAGTEPDFLTGVDRTFQEENYT